MGKVQEREREGHRVSHGAGHSSRYGAGSGAASRACRAGSGRWHSGVCSENRKQEAKLWKPRWKGIFARLKTIYFFGFLFSVYGWSGRGALAHGPGGLASSLSAASSTCSKTQVCVRAFWDRQLTENHVYAGQEMPNWGFPVLTSYLHSQHPKPPGEGSALGTGCCCNNPSPLSLGGGGMAPLGAVTEKPPACPLLGQISPKVHPQVPCRGGQRAAESTLF